MVFRLTFHQQEEAMFVDPPRDVSSSQFSSARLSSPPTRRSETISRKSESVFRGRRRADDPHRSRGPSRRRELLSCAWIRCSRMQSRAPLNDITKPKMNSSDKEQNIIFTTYFKLSSICKQQNGNRCARYRISLWKINRN